MNDTLYNQILEWIPSTTLKKVISQSGRLSDMTMLSAACLCAPDFEARVGMLGKLAQEFEGELRDFTLRLQKGKILSHLLFTAEDAQAVYELSIREYDEDRWGKRYLCSSYEAARMQIRRHYEYSIEHGGYEEDETAYYQIFKRRIFSGIPMEENSDIQGKAVLKYGGVLTDVDMWRGMEEGVQNCQENCFVCDRLCIESMPDEGEHRVEYPCFAKNADPVRYYQEGRWRFGVVLRWKEEPTHECYVIPMDSAVFKYRMFERMRNMGECIPAPFVDVISSHELPEEMQETYAAFAAQENREYVGRRRSTGMMRF